MDRATQQASTIELGSSTSSARKPVATPPRRVRGTTKSEAAALAAAVDAAAPRICSRSMMASTIGLPTASAPGPAPSSAAAAASSAVAALPRADAAGARVLQDLTAAKLQASNLHSRSEGTAAPAAKLSLQKLREQTTVLDVIGTGGGGGVVGGPGGGADKWRAPLPAREQSSVSQTRAKVMGSTFSLAW